jgi:CheY-like chemotaxis protein
VCDITDPDAAAGSARDRARYDVVFSRTPIAWSDTTAPAPKWIRLVRDGDDRDRDRDHERPAIELSMPVRRWRLVGALRHALGVAAPPRRARTTAGIPRLLQLRVLVAEDNLINQEVTLGMLADLGCTAICVGDGQQALDLLARESFDLVLMDCQMPVMDGFEATREQRRRERASDAHQIIIALTANAGHEDREACRASGMDDFLSKPFQRSDLVKLLLRHLRTSALFPSTETAPGAGSRAAGNTSVPPFAAGAPAPASAVLGPAPVISRRPILGGAGGKAPRGIDERSEEIGGGGPERSEEIGGGDRVIDRSVLDRIRAIQRPDRPDLVSRVLQLYLERSPAQLEALADAATAADKVRLVRAAHDLKGGSGNLGLVQLVALLARIEQLARNDRLAELPALLSELPAVHAAAVAAVRSELDRCTPTREPHHA